MAPKAEAAAPRHAALKPHLAVASEISQRLLLPTNQHSCRSSETRVKNTIVLLGPVASPYNTLHLMQRRLRVADRQFLIGRPTAGAR
jgi:hypothetical protein